MFRCKSSRAAGGEHDERTDAMLLQSKDFRLGNGESLVKVVQKVVDRSGSTKSVVRSKSNKKKIYLCNVCIFMTTKMR